MLASSILFIPVRAAASSRNAVPGAGAQERGGKVGRAAVQRSGADHHGVDSLQRGFHTRGDRHGKRLAASGADHPRLRDREAETGGVSV